MEQAYKKQCRFALFSFLIVLALTHIFPLYFIFPEFDNIFIFGFPASYLTTLVVGWIGTMIFYWFYIQISENIDREIEETSAAAVEAEEAKGRSGQGPTKA